MGSDMSMVIRVMKVEDISDVKRVDLLSWGDLMRSRYPEVEVFPPRTDMNILSYIRSDREGALVALDSSAGIIGSSFSHVWGRTGWVGPLSVLPSYQGRGVGKELAKESFSYLERRGCTDIGLETMPESTVNLGMYMRIGLRPAGLVLSMARPLEDDDDLEEVQGGVAVERLSESRAKDKIMPQLRALSGTLQPGLDYSPEVVLTDEHSFGDTLIALKRGRLAGFAVVHTVPRREGMEAAHVRVLAADPSLGDTPVEPLMSSAELMAVDARSREISVPVPAAYHRVSDILLSRGYSVSQTYERMVWSGSPGVAAGAVNLCSWSG